MSANLKNAIRAVNKTALLYGSVGTLALSGMAGIANAQEGSQLQTEEVIVTGIRASLERALDIKRNAVGAVSAVSSEDIGEFPANNVAASLMRVPGVSVSGQFGEADGVSIRGASNGMTLTTLNGHAVASTSWYTEVANDRSFNYSMLPTQLVSSIVVHKSSAANRPEGGVGGTVNVITHRPLDLEANTAYLGLEANYSTGSGEVDPEISGLYSYKNDSETFGFLVAGAMSEYSYVRRGNEGLPVWSGYVSATHFEQQRERTALNGVIQFAPTDEIDFGFSYMSLELVADNVNTAVWIPQNLTNVNDNGTPNNEDDDFTVRAFEDCEYYDQPAAPTSGDGENLHAPMSCTNTAASSIVDVYWEARVRNATMTSDTYNAWFTYATDAFEVNLNVGKTEAEGGTNFESKIHGFAEGASALGTIDQSGDQVEWDLVDPNFGLAELEDGFLGVATGAIVTAPNIDEEAYFSGDFTYFVDAGAISSVEAGFRWSDHDVATIQYSPVLTTGAPVSAEEFIDGTLEVGTEEWTVPAPNADKALAYTKSLITGWNERLSAHATINEENLALFVMATLDAGDLAGNFGLRYISTDVSGQYHPLTLTGYSQDLATAESSYSDVLPSLNLKLNLAEDLVLRFAAAQVITRANYQDMFPSASLRGQNDQVQQNETVIQGNIGLKPFKASQASLGLEWYFTDQSLLSLAYFTKDVKNFTTTSITRHQSIGVVSPDTGTDDWLVQSLKNGNSGTIDGIEFAAQHVFDSGFGANFNYTFAYTNTDPSNYIDRNGVLTDSSRHTANVAAFYETDLFAARAAYSWRSEYMIREVGFYSNRQHQPYGTLNLGFSLYATDNITVTFNGLNVLEEDSIQVGNDQGNVATFLRTTEGYPAYSYAGEARYSLGVNFEF